jgi:hypothetical protein
LTTETVTRSSIPLSGLGTALPKEWSWAISKDKFTQMKIQLLYISSLALLALRLVGPSAFAQTTPTVQVKTIADLVALPIPIVSSRLTALVTGRLTENDGYGGTFFYQAGATTATNRGTVFAGTGGRWIRQFSGGLNIGWFGAVGDTNTECSVAAQDAVNVAQLTTGGREVIIPDGTFKMENIVVTNQRVTISGNGWGNTWIQKSADNTNAVFRVSGEMFTLRNINIRADFSFTNHFSNVQISGVSDTSIHDVWIFGGWHNLDLFYVSNPQLNHCIFESSKHHAVYMKQCNLVTVIGNVFAEPGNTDDEPTNAEAALMLDYDSTYTFRPFSFSITGNYFNFGRYCHFIHATHTEAVSIVGNFFQLAGQFNPNTKDDIRLESCDRTEIVGNTSVAEFNNYILPPDPNSRASRYVVNIDAGCTHTQLSANGFQTGISGLFNDLGTGTVYSQSDDVIPGSVISSVASYPNNYVVTFRDKNNGYTSCAFLTLNTNNTFVLAAGNTASNGIRIDTNGNVMLGTSAPLARLTVNGDAVIGAAGTIQLRDGTTQGIWQQFGLPWAFLNNKDSVNAMTLSTNGDAIFNSSALAPLLVAGSTTKLREGAVADITQPSVQLTLGHSITWPGPSGGFSDAGFLRYATNAALQIGAGNSTRLAAWSNGVVQIPGLTASQAIVTDTTNGLASSVTTATELAFVHGVTNDIQTQLNNTHSGETNTASNLGNGIGVFNSKSGLDLRFNSITNGTYLDISSNANMILADVRVAADGVKDSTKLVRADDSRLTQGAFSLGSVITFNGSEGWTDIFSTSITNGATEILARVVAYNTTLDNSAYWNGEFLVAYNGVTMHYRADTGAFTSMDGLSAPLQFDGSQPTQAGATSLRLTNSGTTLKIQAQGTTIGACKIRVITGLYVTAF